MSGRDHVRWAVVGIGAMGAEHAKRLLAGEVARGKLTAVVHPDAARHGAFAPAAGFVSIEALAAARAADAVLIATPQTTHADLGRRALAAGLHVLIEKPLTHTHAEAKGLLTTPRRAGQSFGVMMNQRTHPAHAAVREVVRSGRLGRLQRVAWTVTDWFRTQRYFDDRPWRGTWAGEGGGVLINQALHQLDLYGWFFGRPRRVVAHCGFGKYHAIETEDDVTAYFEHPGGMTGTFIASTGEAPGLNRLEVTGHGGRLTLEDDRIVLRQNAVGSAEVLRESAAWFDAPACEAVRLPDGAAATHRGRVWGGQHAEFVERFTAAVLDGTPPPATAEDGLAALELTNAIHLSAWTDRPVGLPLDDAAFLAGFDARTCRTTPA